MVKSKEKPVFAPPKTSRSERIRKNSFDNIIIPYSQKKSIRFYKKYSQNYRKAGYIRNGLYKTGRRF